MLIENDIYDQSRHTNVHRRVTNSLLYLLPGGAHPRYRNLEIKKMTKLACATCGKESDINVPGCGLWLCPFDGAVNRIAGDQGEGEEWLACLPFQGEERLLPVGYQIRSPGLFILDFVAAYQVLDKGQIKMINPWEAGSGVPGKILSVVINEKAVEIVQATYGGRGIVIEDANGRRLTVPEWRADFGTDPIAQLAIMRAYLATTGPGVQTYRPAGTKFGIDATRIEGAGQQRTHTGRTHHV